MASPANYRGAAVAILIAAMLTIVIGSFVAWGNSERVCYNDGQPETCSPAQQTAIKMVANAMGELVVTLGTVELLAGIVLGWLGWRPQGKHHDSS